VKVIQENTAYLIKISLLFMLLFFAKGCETVKEAHGLEADSTIEVDTRIKYYGFNSAVAGLIVVDSSLIELTGNPPFSPCSLMRSIFSAL